jgi:uncharacterized protein YggT (Ycf19 family)
MRLLCILIRAFEFVFLVRMVLSFFPIKDQTLAASARQVAVFVTDPVVAPIAELLVLIGLQLLDAIICRL